MAFARKEENLGDAVVSRAMSFTRSHTFVPGKKFRVDGALLFDEEISHFAGNRKKPKKKKKTRQEEDEEEKKKAKEGLEGERGGRDGLQQKKSLKKKEGGLFHSPKSKLASQISKRNRSLRARISTVEEGKQKGHKGAPEDEDEDEDEEEEEDEEEDEEEERRPLFSGLQVPSFMGEYTKIPKNEKIENFLSGGGLFLPYGSSLRGRNDGGEEAGLGREEIQTVEGRSRGVYQDTFSILSAKGDFKKSLSAYTKKIQENSLIFDRTHVWTELDQLQVLVRPHTEQARSSALPPSLSPSLSSLCPSS